MKQCIIEDCCNECEKNRRYCRKHYLERKRQQSKNRYKTGITKKKIFCELCGNPINAFRKSQRFCLCCYRKIQKCSSFQTNGYSNAKGGNYCWLHRKIAESQLKRTLGVNQIVHHLDGNQQNNDITNLLVMRRSDHTSLHSYLKIQRALLLKNSNGNFENCWKNLIVPITTTWLEMTSVKVIKIWEIGQSAAESL